MQSTLNKIIAIIITILVVFLITIGLFSIYLPIILPLLNKKLLMVNDIILISFLLTLIYNFPFMVKILFPDKVPKGVLILIFLMSIFLIYGFFSGFFSTFDLKESISSNDFNNTKAVYLFMFSFISLILFFKNIFNEMYKNDLSNRSKIRLRLMLYSFALILNISSVISPSHDNNTISIIIGLGDKILATLIICDVLFNILFTEINKVQHFFNIINNNLSILKYPLLIFYIYFLIISFVVASF
ncbi:hypothetical protein K4O97_01475 [Staphylococcus epidermidis]|nr:hypothetical protein [Staphylococcus epidermidis]MCG1638004.1 hypothetical protein [Staphylococcus epidermidis]MCG1860902.1 hypothetical protein [Staphylococcus epidermidis]